MGKWNDGTVSLFGDSQAVTDPDMLPLTLAGLAVDQQPVSVMAAAVKTVEHAHTLVITTVVPKRTVVDH